ncbi:MAG: hypothetical protein IPO25_07210 [Saprospiraceae bacterium]|nr:hypothetical protein [Saprospiraceae bacterium]
MNKKMITCFTGYSLKWIILIKGIQELQPFITATLMYLCYIRRGYKKTYWKNSMLLKIRPEIMIEGCRAKIPGNNLHSIANRRHNTLTCHSSEYFSKSTFSHKIQTFSETKFIHYYGHKLTSRRESFPERPG